MIKPHGGILIDQVLKGETKKKAKERTGGPRQEGFWNYQ